MLYVVLALIVVAVALAVTACLWQNAADRAEAAEATVRADAGVVAELRGRCALLEKERDAAKLEAAALRANAVKSAEALARSYKRIEGMEAGHENAVKQLESSAAALRVANDRQARMLAAAGELARAITAEVSAC